MSLLPSILYSQQHREKAHCKGAQAPGQPEDDPDQIWVDEGVARPGV